ncbi:PAS domain S-box protein, partial [Candidatus Riflebacteria bacterium]
GIGFNKMVNSLQEGERRLLDMFENSGDIIQQLTPEGKFIFVNDTWSNVLGYPRSEIAELSYLDIIHPDFKDKFQKIFLALVEENGANPGKFEATFLTKNGEKVFTEGSMSCFFEKNIPALVRGIFHDMTERKKIEEERAWHSRQIIEAQQKEYQQFIETANAPILGVDLKGNITEWNLKLALISGYARVKVLGKNLVENYIFEKQRQKVREIFDRAFIGQETANFELTLNAREENKRLVLLLNAKAKHDTTGRIIGALGVAQDITEIIEYREDLEDKIAERTVQLQEALEKEKELGELKSRFISMASHEFRTPLATILSTTEILERYADKLKEEDKANRLNKIKTQVDHLTSLMEDVLTIGKSDAQKLEFKPFPINLKFFCQGLAEEIQAGFADKCKIIFKWTCDCKEEGSKRCEEGLFDGKLLQKLLSNLLSNAVKYTPSGKDVVFQVESQGKEVKFTVTDQGIGIPESDLPRLFEPFHRAKNVGTISGTGLGLNVVKKSAEMHGGKVSVQSKVDEGTTFRVTLPRVTKG